MHRYRTEARWRGSTGAGYEDYSRGHDVGAPPAASTLALSADPAFRGDPSRLNPEQLVVAAASSCQLLSFLACAARARLDVVAYDDDAEGVMPDDEAPLRITRIVLRPRITVRDDGRWSGRHDALRERVRSLCNVAHRECYVANSLTTGIEVDPEVVVQG